MARRRIAIVLTTRGNYAKMKSTMRAVRARSDLELATIVGGGILLERFRDYRPDIVRDGFTVDATAEFLVEDAGTLDAQTRSAGEAVVAFGKALRALRPDIAVVVADRWEALSIALAATCGNVPIAHLEGGEVSGSIDERIRHAISKLSHLHLPANAGAAERIAGLGEDRSRIFVVGTPSLDLLSEVDLSDTRSIAAAPGGEGSAVDFAGDYIVVSHHPVVTEVDDAGRQVIETAKAVATAQLPVVWLLPNMDAGGVAVMSAIARVRADGLGVPVRLYPSMAFEHYSVLLANARCLVGNSSSGIREGAFLGTPVVNVGTRQRGRERGRNVIDVPAERAAIAGAMSRQIAHGRYPRDTIYGDGRSGERIADVLSSAPLGLDKFGS
jgi:UDP-hydrolysing UDP-N-acetyl-D-glucosamine 2-epimerase